MLQRLRGTCPLDADRRCSARRHRARCCARPATRGTCARPTPYSSYEDFDFKIPVGTVGDNYDRYACACAEMYESAKIIQQALDGLPEGPHITEDRKVALPPRHELATSMEALIHHFKLVTEGFRVPPGEVYYPIESPARRARLLRALGRLLQARPRAHARPLLRQPAGHRPMAEGAYIADLIATLAMLDPVLGGIDR